MTTTREAVKRIVAAAEHDVIEGIPERHSTNTGLSLVKRLGLRGLFGDDFRKGDGSAARQIYSGAYFLFSTHRPASEET